MNFRHVLGSLLLAFSSFAACAAASGCQGDNKPPPKLIKGQVHLTLLHTSDIHSRLFPYNLQIGQVDAGLGLGEAGSIVNVGGAARISHIIGRERARASRALHLDGGDCFQGAPIFNFFSGEAEVRTLSAMGTDAMIVANHEFDRGVKNLGIQLQSWATFPVLAANYALDDPKQPGAAPLGTILKPFTVFELSGLKVGVVGMGNLSTITSLFERPNNLGLAPLNTIETTQFYVDLLRPLVDVIVFVTHLGLDVDERMIEGTSGIDVVLGGHNHIVLQPPKRVRDCSAHFDDAEQKNFIELVGPEDFDPSKGCKADADCETRFCSGSDADRAKGGGVCKVKRLCTPRDVILAHSGAFAKYVGRLDLILSNDPDDLTDRDYHKEDGFEILTQDYQLFPVTEQVPSDPIVFSLLEQYAQGLDAMASLDTIVGYALDGSKRNGTSGGDSPLGNLISTAMWRRQGIQTDFSLTNSTGIRADLVPGPVTIEQMFNIFPFDNSITKMQVSGQEVQEMFDFVARRSAGRACVSQVQIAGARVILDCTKPGEFGNGVATNIYIGVVDPLVKCSSDAQCPGQLTGSCDVEAGVCWQPIDPIGSYELATSNYLAGGGSGFRALQRNTTQVDTKVQQRDALIDYLQAGAPCGAVKVDDKLIAKPCTTDADCGDVGAGEGFICACPAATIEGPVCTTDPNTSCSKGAGACVLAKCRNDVAAFIRATCNAASTSAVQKQCEMALLPCSAAGDQCKYLACIDRTLGNFSDGRIRMVGQ
jgi:5'-nucleotidase/UDP-sugar diphosphatase